jgi:hypothetical protein
VKTLCNTWLVLKTLHYFCSLLGGPAVFFCYLQLQKSRSNETSTSTNVPGFILYHWAVAPVCLHLDFRTEGKFLNVFSSTPDQVHPANLVEVQRHAEETHCSDLRDVIYIMIIIAIMIDDNQLETSVCSLCHNVGAVLM